MKINKMTDYAIRAIRVIHIGQNTVVTSKVIAEKEGIPHGVLMKVLRQLRQNGIVQSHQGRGELTGGFSLVKSPKELTLLEVMEAIEGSLSLNEFFTKKDYSDTLKACGVYDELNRCNEIFRQELGRYPLEKFFG